MTNAYSRIHKKMIRGKVLQPKSKISVIRLTSINVVHEHLLQLIRAIIIRLVVVVVKEA
jgi:hypothetical protein